MNDAFGAYLFILLFIAPILIFIFYLLIQALIFLILIVIPISKNIVIPFIIKDIKTYLKGIKMNHTWIKLFLTISCFATIYTITQSTCTKSPQVLESKGQALSPKYYYDELRIGDYLVNKKTHASQEVIGLSYYPLDSTLLWVMTGKGKVVYAESLHNYLIEQNFGEIKIRTGKE